MANEIDFDEILSKYRSDPFDYVEVCATHTGIVRFRVGEGDAVEAPSGEWQQVPGTALYQITRERNPKLVAARTNGVVAEIRSELEGQFVEAGEKLMVISPAINTSQARFTPISTCCWSKKKMERKMAANAANKRAITLGCLSFWVLPTVENRFTLEDVV